MTVEAGFAWALRKFSDTGAADGLDGAVRTRVRELAASRADLSRPSSADLSRRAAARDRASAAALLAEVPAHWKPLVHRLLDGSSTPKLAGSVAAERLGWVKHDRASLEVTHADARVLGLRCCGAVFGRLDRRAALRFSRVLTVEERDAFDGGAAAPLADDAHRILRDAWARFSADSPREKAVVDLGLYTLAFVVADNETILRTARIAEDLRVRFDELVRTARHSSRRSSVEDLRGFMEGAKQ